MICIFNRFIESTSPKIVSFTLTDLLNTLKSVMTVLGLAECSLMSPGLNTLNPLIPPK